MLRRWLSHARIFWPLWTRGWALPRWFVQSESSDSSKFGLNPLLIEFFVDDSLTQGSSDSCKFGLNPLKTKLFVDDSLTHESSGAVSSGLNASSMTRPPLEHLGWNINKSSLETVGDSIARDTEFDRLLHPTYSTHLDAQDGSDTKRVNALHHPQHEVNMHPASFIWETRPQTLRRKPHRFVVMLAS